MKYDKHDIGFEREERFREAFWFLREQCPNVYKIEILYKLLEIIDPKIYEGLYERRTCKRKLQYIGEPDDFFEQEKTYNSINYNGGTYSIEGYDRLIGSAHFEVIDELSN